MPRFKLTIEYDGGPFLGWQRTGEGMSVQSRLESAVESLTGARSDVVGAGRTDSGVHALAQVAHVDLTRDWRGDKLRDALNAHLRPEPIAILKAQRVDDDFHARFSATGRTYLYRIVDRRPDLTLDRGRAWRIPQKLCVVKLREAAQFLIGRHDFSTFRDSECQAQSPIKTLDRLHVDRVGQEVHFTLCARSFLHRQVRSMVGTLAEAGRGVWSPEEVRQALIAADRAACGPVAPPDGLYLTSVAYPDQPLFADGDAGPTQS